MPHAVPQAGVGSAEPQAGAGVALGSAEPQAGAGSALPHAGVALGSAEPQAVPQAGAGSVVPHAAKAATFSRFSDMMVPLNGTRPVGPRRFMRAFSRKTIF